MRVWLSMFMLAAFCMSVSGQTVASLPAEVRRRYVAEVDASISDEFNAASLDTNKWGRRHSRPESVGKFAGDESLVAMESETSPADTTVRYLSVKATAKGGAPRTAGIVSRASGYFGFYVVKFRYRGLDAPDVQQKRTIWHPSVWSAITDHAKDKSRKSTNSRFWLEIDLMEWETAKHGWSSDAPARLVDSTGEVRKVVTKGPGLEKAIMKDEVAIADDGWQTVGLEYTPEYLKLWQWKNGEWGNYSDREVNFVEHDLQTPESRYTISTIGRKAAQPCFWVLGNVVSPYLLPRIEAGTVTQTMRDMSFDIDFFRYYRHKSIEEADWMWENQLPSGG